MRFVRLVPHEALAESRALFDDVRKEDLDFQAHPLGAARVRGRLEGARPREETVDGGALAGVRAPMMCGLATERWVCLAVLAPVACGFGSHPLAAPTDAAVDSPGGGAGTDAAPDAPVQDVPDGGTPPDCALGTPGAPPVAWVRQTSGGVWLYSMAVTPRGEVAIAGAFAFSVTLGSGEAGETTLESAGGATEDAFVALYRSDGTLAWAHRAGGPTFDDATAVAAGADGAVFVAGRVGPDATFGEDGAGETQVDALGLFVARYAADGSLQWVRTSLDENDPNYNPLLRVTPAGLLLMVGRMGDVITLGTGGVDETTLLGPGLFAAELSGDGAFRWARRVALDDGWVMARGLDVAADGGFSVTGALCYGVTFGPDDPSATTFSNANGCAPIDEPHWEDMFVATYAAEGELAWAASAGGARGDGRASASAALPIAETVLVVGAFEGDARFDGLDMDGEVGERDPFLADYDDAGQIASVTSPWRNGGAGLAFRDASGGVVAAGLVDFNAATVDPGGPEELTISCPATFVVRLDPDFATDWVKVLPFERGNGDGRNFMPVAMAPVENGGVVLAGGFSGAQTVGIGEEQETVLRADGFAGFVMKLGGAR